MSETPFPKVNETEARVLSFLGQGSHGDWCHPFAPIVEDTGFDRPSVRRACRALTRKGLARFERGLWSEETDRPAGSGYGCTPLGYLYLAQHGKAGVA